MLGNLVSVMLYGRIPALSAAMTTYSSSIKINRTIGKLKEIKYLHFNLNGMTHFYGKYKNT